MKIELGKYYRNRRRGVMGPIRKADPISIEEGYPFMEEESDRTFTDEGRYVKDDESVQDLIEEVIVLPEESSYGFTRMSGTSMDTPLQSQSMSVLFNGLFKRLDTIIEKLSSFPEKEGKAQEKVVGFTPSGYPVVVTPTGYRYNEEESVAPNYAIPGKFYIHPTLGKMLACGTSDPSRYYPAFVHLDQRGTMAMKFLSQPDKLILAKKQSWENEQ